MAFSEQALQILDAWTEKWIDQDGIFEVKKEGVANAIHSTLITKTQTDQIHCQVDFGTAPIESLLELLYSIQATGIILLLFNLIRNIS